MTTRLLWLLLGSIAGASVIRAQPVVRDSSVVSVEPCTYVKCVLAISRPKRGDERLMIGSLGRTETLGFSGGAVSHAVAAVPAARSAASAGRRWRISARVLLYASVSAMGYLAMRRAVSRKVPPLVGNFIGLAEGAGRGLLIVVPAAVIAIPVERRANEHFDHALRLFNEQLPR